MPGPGRRPPAQSAIQRLVASLSIDPAERRLGGIVGGLLWIVSGATLLLYPLLPGGHSGDVVLTTVLACLAALWGVVTVGAIDWRTAHQWVPHLSMLGAVVAVPIAVSATGAAHSTAWIYLLWVGLYASYFFSQPVAIAYLVLCVIAQSMPLFYARDAVDHGFVTTLVTSAAGYAVLGGGVMAGRRLVARLRGRAETLAAEQGALQRVATAVIAGESSEHVFELAAAEVAELFDAAIVGILQRVDDMLLVLGEWADDSVTRIPLGAKLPLTPNGSFAVALSTGKAVRELDHGSDSIAHIVGVDATLLGPIVIEDEIWGLVALGAHGRGSYARSDEQHLTAFCQLIATIVTNLHERARLADEAMTDPLTGLGNQRSLQERLRAELARVERHGRVLSVAVLDVDNFKGINDTGGHAAGDEALRRVADCLREVSRAGDTIGRFGGDEFMWIMPDTDRHEAELAVQRARALIAGRVSAPIRVTSSAGICDTRASTDAAELLRLADIAMYASKIAGRDQVTIYNSEVGIAFSGRTRGEWVQRSQALAGLRALARAIDAKDPDTREHSERVADFSGRLALAAGWSEEQIARLREAALVHDVGKLGVPDAILTKSAQLTEAERMQMEQHAELSARIVAPVLSEEQVEWIRCHHERPDGNGYPGRMAGDEIPAGAAMIALADSWDVMVVGRPYTGSKSVECAYEECVSLAGQQFSHEAVAALTALRERGELIQSEAPAADSMHERA